MHFYWITISSIVYVVVDTQKIVDLVWMLPNNERIVTEKHTHYNKTQKMAQVSQIVRAKENLIVSYGGPSQRQTSDSNQRIYTLPSGPSLSLSPYPPSCN